MMKKVLVKGPALSLSGYGEQARFALRSLRNREDIDLYFINISWGKTGLFFKDEEEKQWLTELSTKTQNLIKQTNGKPNFDVSVQVTIPNEFEKIADYNIGYTAGIETTKVSPEWLSKCNQMNKIIVPSKHSKQVFMETEYKGVIERTQEETVVKMETGVDVCSFPAKEIEPKDIDLQLETDFNFLSVVQWGVRKNLESTIVNFLQEFKDDDNVGLVLKVNITKNTMMDKELVRLRLKRVVDDVREKYGDFKCRLYLLHGSLTDEEMKSLYLNTKIKALVSTTHGEGFGLPIMEAALSELPIIAPAWSGHIDFLFAPKKVKNNKTKNKPHFTKIDFDINPVQQNALWKGVIEKNSKWCWVRDTSVRASMREVFKNYGPKLSDAKKLANHILTELSEDKQKDLFHELVVKNFVSQAEVADEIFS